MRRLAAYPSPRRRHLFRVRAKCAILRVEVERPQLAHEEGIWMPEGPIRGLRFIHNAIRVQAREVEDALVAAASPTDATKSATTVHLLTGAVRPHVHGEDVGYFPQLRERLPRAADAFQFDHDAEKERLDELDRLVGACASDEQLAELRRHAVVVREHLDLHMTKEEQILWPQTEEAFSPQEQGAIIGAVLGVIPQEQMVTLVPWLVDRQSSEEAISYMRMLQHVQPAEVFAMFTGWVREGSRAERWDELIAAMPELSSSG
jgi:hemerythrin-like domain-containing protein